MTRRPGVPLLGIGTRYTVLVVVTLALPSAAAPQRGLNIGARTGLSIASLGGADAERVDARTAFAPGVVASLGLSERLALEVHVAYVPKGGTMTGAFDGTVTYRFNYIEAPALVRYSLVPRARVRPALVIGLAPAFRLNSTTTSGSGLTADSFPRQLVFPKPKDLGLVLGTSLGIPAGRHQLRLDASYTLGLTRLAATQFTDFTGGRVENPDVDLKNTSLTLAFGYVVRLGRARAP